MSGYEKKVTENVITFLSKVAREHHLQRVDLFARIMKRGNEVHLDIFHQGKVVDKVTVEELVEFFTGDQFDLLDLQAKIEQGLIIYINEFSQRYQIHENQLHFGITSVKHAIHIHAYNHRELITKIPLSELIKQFNS